MARKKTATKKALPKNTAVPAGMQAIEHAKSWNPEEPGDAIHFNTVAPIKKVPFNDGTRRVVEVKTKEGETLALWENAALRKLFETIEGDGVGGEYFVRYDGLGEAPGPDLNPPKLFSVFGAASESSNPF